MIILSEFWSVIFSFSFFRCDSSICDKEFKLKQMTLDFEYGINTGNRFLDLVDHDEDPDEFIAGQKQSEEKAKKSTKDTKSTTSTASKKTTTKTTTTTTTPASTTNVSSSTTRTNKENLTGKSTNPDQRRQQSNVLSDNNNQQTRVDSGRGREKKFFWIDFFIFFIL